MDDILNLDKIYLFVLFVMPGFIALKAYDLLVPGISKPTSEQLIDAVAYSTMNYALLSIPIYSIETSGIAKNSPGWYVAFYMFVILIFPFSMVCSWIKLRDTEYFKNVFHHPIHRPWDYVFGKGKSYWVVVTLKNGTTLGGMYHYNSFASGLPHDESIFLEESWKINEKGAFERKYNESAGILILSSEMMTVEFFNLTEGESNDEGKGERPKDISADNSRRVSAGEGPEIE